MCRRLFYHFMHCDVRERMTVPEQMIGAEAGVYENFLRTYRHRCEARVKVHDPEQAVLGDLPVVECEWHSCCLEGEAVSLCSEGVRAIDEDEDFEPEMCDYYALEHHHSQIRNPCFGGACRGLMCIQNLSSGPVDAKGRWPELGDPIWYETWDPVYHQPAKLRAKWEERLFKRMAKLTIINKDLATHAAVLHDISGDASPANSSCVEAAARNYIRCNKKVQKQHRRIERGLRWAAARETR